MSERIFKCSQAPSISVLEQKIQVRSEAIQNGKSSRKRNAEQSWISSTDVKERCQSSQPSSPDMRIPKLSQIPSTSVLEQKIQVSSQSNQNGKPSRKRNAEQEWSTTTEKESESLPVASIVQNCEDRTREPSRRKSQAFNAELGKHRKSKAEPARENSSSGVPLLTSRRMKFQSEIFAQFEEARRLSQSQDSEKLKKLSRLQSTKSKSHCSQPNKLKSPSSDGMMIDSASPPRAHDLKALLLEENTQGSSSSVRFPVLPSITKPKSRSISRSKSKPQPNLEEIDWFA